jgi:hypothetical protein
MIISAVTVPKNSSLKAKNHTPGPRIWYRQASNIGGPRRTVKLLQSVRILIKTINRNLSRTDHCRIGGWGGGGRGSSGVMRTNDVVCPTASSTVTKKRPVLDYHSVHPVSGFMVSIGGFHLKTHILCKVKATLFTCLDINNARRAVKYKSTHSRWRMKNNSLLHALAALPAGRTPLYQTKKWPSVTCRQRAQYCSWRTLIHDLSASSELLTPLSCGLFNNPADIEAFIELNNTVLTEW